MKPWKKVVLTLVSTLLLITLACQKNTNDESTAQGLTVDKKFRWPNATVSLCFNEDLSEVSFSDYMPTIQKIAEDEYNAKTIFKFTGFHTCTQGRSDEIAVAFKKFGRANATAARTTSSEPIFVLASVLRHFVPSLIAGNIVNFYSEYSPGWFEKHGGARQRAIYQHNMIVHELGHAVGLLHEQARTDNKNNSFCDNKDSQARQSQPGQISVGSFDSYSVMNYCNDDFAFQEVHLSQGDINAVNSLYSEGSSHIKNPDDPLGDVKMKHNCSPSAKILNFDGCAEVLKIRAALRGSKIPSINGSKLVNISEGCRKKYKQIGSCNSRLFRYLFETWPIDNFNCVANGGGWGCVEPATVAP